MTNAKTRLGLSNLISKMITEKEIDSSNLDTNYDSQQDEQEQNSTHESTNELEQEKTDESSKVCPHDHYDRTISHIRDDLTAEQSNGLFAHLRFGCLNTRSIKHMCNNRLEKNI